MNTSSRSPRTLIGAAVASALLAACSSSPARPTDTAALRTRLTELQTDQQLAGHAPLAMEQADRAVTAAEQPQADPTTHEHLKFMADRKISIAAAEAHNHWSIEQRQKITEQRSAMMLQSRTQEADDANARTVVAQGNADAQARMANAAMSDAAGARQDAAGARQDTADLQHQLDDMQARVTDRGVVLTLGDVLFTSGTADLRIGGDTHLAQLAVFLNRYPLRSARIEGHTDNVGGLDYNQALSQRRADSVKSFLVTQGIGTARLTAAGMGEGTPVGDNATPTGRQQNRRVEVIISDDLVTAR